MSLHLSASQLAAYIIHLSASQLAAYTERLCDHPPYPFTPPSWMPRISCFCSSTKTRISGITDIVTVAISRCVAWPCSRSPKIP